MAYNTINDAAKALYSSITTAAKEAAFSPTSSTEELLEGAALVKAAKAVGELVYIIPSETAVLPEAGVWVRPIEWLPMPTLTKADNTFAGLFAVFPEGSNVVALSAAGDYTVDWGDGAVENFTQDSTAEHTYNYASIVGTPFRGYKQVMIKVYPQVGATLTSVNLVKKHSSLNSYTGIYKYPYLEIKFYSDTATTFFTENTAASPTRILNLSMLEHIDMSFSSMGSLGYLLHSSKSIQKVTIKDSTIANLSNAFQSSTVIEVGMTNLTCPQLGSTFTACSSLFKVTAFDVVGGSTATSCFSQCVSLQSFPDLYLEGTWSVGNMFDGSGLIETPNIICTGSAYAYYMFANCRSLVRVKTIDFAVCTSYDYTFSNCPSLAEVYPIKLNASSCGSMFSSCPSLREPPVMTLATNNISLSSMFSATGIEEFDSDKHLTGSGTVSSWISTFSSCQSLKSIKFSNFYGSTSISSLATSCNSLQYLVLPSVASISSLSAAAPTTSDLRSVRLPGATKAIDVSNNRLSAAALNQVFTDLGTVTAATTITVKGNPGILEPGYDPTIATAKGWTVAAT